MIIDEDVEAFLEHYGVRGQKWGVRRKQNRALNKASRQKDWEAQGKEVGEARANVKTGKTKKEFKQAKKEYKANKEKLGSREARKILNQAREKKYNEIDKSQQAKNKKEAAAILGIVGAVIVGQAFLNAKKY